MNTNHPRKKNTHQNRQLMVLCFVILKKYFVTTRRVGQIKDSELDKGSQSQKCDVWDGHYLHLPYTPPKSNIDTKNDGFLKCISGFKYGVILGPSMLAFGGVSLEMSPKFPGVSLVVGFPNLEIYK